METRHQTCNRGLKCGSVHRTEPRLRECAFDTCAVECGNCTEDDQCETGFYCSKTLKKCVDAEASQRVPPSTRPPPPKARTTTETNVL
eukprot:2251819-Amphidinium_carterae.1